MKRATVIFILALVLVCSVAPVAEAKRDPNCYVDLYAWSRRNEARRGFYVGLIGTGVGVGFAVSGFKSNNTQSKVLGVALGSAGAALAVYNARQLRRYRDLETCGILR